MKTILTVVAFLVAAVIAQEEKHYIDYRLASNQASIFQNLVGPQKIECTTQGKICDPDCKRIWTCIYNNGVLTPALLDTCKDDQTCNNGTCNVIPSPECAVSPDHDFVCHAEGVFPDPRTCKKYHYCITNEDSGESGGGTTSFSTYAQGYDDHERSCSKDRGYNSRTTYCDKPLKNDQCGAEYPVPICKTPGQVNALKDNPSIFYVCSLYNNQGEVLYPYLYLCKDGQVYDDNYGCKPPK